MASWPRSRFASATRTIVLVAAAVAGAESHIATLQRWPAMQDWTAAGKAEPWVIKDDVNASVA